MPLRKLFQSSALHLAFVYALAFSVSVGLLFSLMIWMVSTEVADQLKTQIDQDVALFEMAAKEGDKYLLESVRRHAALAQQEGDAFYSLREINGRILAGQPTPLVQFEGLRKITVPEKLEGPRKEDEEETLLIHGFIAGDSIVLVGRSMESVLETRELLLRSGLSLSGFGIVIALLSGLLVGFQSSRRIENITRTAQEIMAGKLSSRIPDDKGKSELSRLAQTINAMLDKIEDLLIGMQRVTDDIAHDLRTPLARLKQNLDKTGRDTNTSIEEMHTALENAEIEVDTILETFSALLRIAQIEAGSRKKRFTRLDLSVLFVKIADTYAPVAEAEGRLFTVRTEPEIMLTGDKNLLTQMLANIIENALRHTPKTTPIELSLSHNGSYVILRVSDHGSGIPQECHSDVFKRFYRLEQSRTTPGSGLGMSLIYAIAKIHGAVITLRDNNPGLIVELRFLRPQR